MSDQGNFSLLLHVKRAAEIYRYQVAILIVMKRLLKRNYYNIARCFDAHKCQGYDPKLSLLTTNDI